MTALREAMGLSSGRVARFWAFATMWAIANIVHLVNQELGQLTSPIAWLNLGVAIAVLRPPSAHRLALLAASQLLHTIWVAPLAPDHAVLAAWVNAILLLAYARLRISDRDIDGGELLSSALGAIRALLLIAYSAAAIAKYNETFFDPVLSCAPFIAQRAGFGFLGGDGVLGFVHIGAATIPETLTPILLMVPWTRRYGVRFGILFHFLVSLSPAVGVWDFSATLFALFALFLSTEETMVAVQDWRERRDARVPDRLARLLLDLAMRIPAGVRWAMFVLLAGGFGFVNETYAIMTMWAVFTIYALRLLIVAGSTLRPSHRPDALFQGLTVPQIGVSMAMVLYVAMPYIGLRTDGVFTMFSNLRTEGPGTNHLFLPSWHVVDLQNDLVVLVESNDEKLSALAEQGQQIPRFEVERTLGVDENLYVIEATEAGDVRLGAAGTPVSSPPRVAAALFHFRATAASGDAQCTN